MDTNSHISTLLRVAVIGPGAIGLFFGGLLSRLGLDVRFLDKSEERAAYLVRHGLLLEEPTGVTSIPLKVTIDTAGIGPCDLVIICVKSYDTESAASLLPSLIHQNTLVLTLQNGLGHVEVLKKVLLERQIAVGVTFHGVTLVETGHIRHAGEGPTYIGSFLSDEKMRGQLVKLAEILTAAGLVTKVVENIEEIVWNKLFINVGINALSALTRLKNGDLVKFPEIQNLMAIAITEALAVARGKGLQVNPQAVEEAKAACLATAENRSSMLQDVLNKKRTEIEAINGAIVKEAKALGIPCPVNEVLTFLVRGIEKSYNLQAER
ncbi:MAG: 2-dehydropantoate 2-reductase [Desulfovibrionales bacterium]|nr:2-dehydropantoate 2-reductase [Desulfovibrionales bacterium]